MIQPIQNRLGVKVIVIIGAFLFISLMSVGYVFFISEKKLLLASLSKRIDLVQKIIKSTLYYHIMPFSDFNKFKSYYSELNQLEDIYRVRLIRGNAVIRQYGIRADSQPVTIEEEKALNGEEVTILRKVDTKILMEKIVPLRADKICLNCHHVIEGEIQGAISITMEIQKVLNTITRRNMVLFFSFLGITISIIIFVYLILRRSVLTPVYELVNAYNEVSRGNLDISLKATSKDEIGMLTRSFNEMVKNLNIQQRALIQSEKLASIGTLTAEVAHRINNPLAIILMRVEHILESLRRGDSSEPGYEQMIKDLEVVLKHGRDISNTVSNLLNRSGVSKNDITDVALNDVLREVSEFVEKMASKRGIKIKTLLNSSSPVIRCNRNDIQQVFLSILFNAVDALESKRADEEKIIEIKYLAQKKNLCEIAISDNGCGIPSEYLNRIFDPFFTTKESGRGTGLGLTIAYNIIQGIGGKIWAESREGEGTTFYIQLPAVRFEGKPL